MPSLWLLTGLTYRAGIPSIALHCLNRYAPAFVQGKLLKSWGAPLSNTELPLDLAAEQKVFHAAYFEGLDTVVLSS